MSKPFSNQNTLLLRLGVIMTMAGFFIFLLGIDPGLFNLNRSPVVGFVQTATFSLGLAITCLGGYMSLKAAKGPQHETSIVEDIGLRLVGTGYLIALVSSMADVFGFGTQAWPAPPFFGPWQAAGVVIGEVIIALGFLLYIPR
ncbi:MAG: hypothetical protein KGY39_00650 [Anaerolineales bacterium]|jgi:hypothetical protein|nr:hypothetical protein [Anaerolineales bacterium]MBS3753706.1 hypothetical protein [Anaerolineales bacterium]